MCGIAVSYSKHGITNWLSRLYKKTATIRYQLSVINYQLIFCLMKKLLGLIGYPLSHSFSKKYFTQKFENQGLSHEWEYELFSIEKIEKIEEILRGYPNLVGLNVTIPYKELVMPYVHELDGEAAAIGAVNCIKIKDGKLKGFNTDVYGFEKSILGLIAPHGGEVKHLKALVLGTGGAAKGVVHVMKKLGMDYKWVSRTRSEGILSYADLTKDIVKTHTVIINTTPLGMSPNTEGCPPIPYKYIGNQHFMYDLIYNPELTTFMMNGIEHGAKAKSGLDMLHFQAEKGWEIWNM
jgi:shikimate dehydrogenase